jgi:hypothetical protein
MLALRRERRAGQGGTAVSISGQNAQEVSLLNATGSTSTGKYFSSGAALAQGTLDALSKGEKPAVDTSGARWVSQAVDKLCFLAKPVFVTGAI